jgi:hypothetical protein
MKAALLIASALFAAAPTPPKCTAVICEMTQEEQRAFERAVELWRVCPSTGCVQSRQEIEGTVLVWT